MRKFYFLLLAALGGGTTIGQAQSWQPFRAGLIYAYQPSGGSATSDVYTFRVDSAYVTTAGDSVFTFNRVMRQASGIAGGTFYKSRNNLFGTRLQWRPGTFDYQLFADADARVGQGATALLLRPRAAVGSTWTASQSPALTATLTSRSLQSFGSPAVTDSLVVITLSNGKVVRMSRRYGLVSATELVKPYTGLAGEYGQAQLPATLLQSAYSPLAVFDMQPEDELGYVQEPFSYGLACSRTHIFRRIKSRRQTADSLIYTYQEQSRTQSFGVPSCGFPAGTSTSAVQNGRLAISLRTGQSGPAAYYGRTSPALLSGEYDYRQTSGAVQPLYVGGGLVYSGQAGCLGSARVLRYQVLYPYQYSTSPGLYWPALDALTWSQGFSSELGLGALYTGDTALRYYRRTRGSTVTTCGTRSDFATLLPTHAAQAAAVFQAFPNPTTGSLQLQLAAPARPGTSLLVQDALGRRIGSLALPAGQTTVPVSLHDQPAGVYLVQLRAADGSVRTVRVQKLP